MNLGSHFYMQHALELAEKGQFTVSPNPMVGCVIVRGESIVGKGYHHKAGEAHAEIHALNAAGLQAQNATVYLTLEPCCHYGRTPPCTDALIKAKVKKVIIACLDPNPLVAGKGVEALRTAGIEVEIGLEAAKAKQLNEIFFHYITTKRPFVIAKWAMSLDGKTTTHINDSRQISCPETQCHAHHLRQQVDAILVGAQTVLRDNPLLTVRHSTQQIEKKPLRIILTRHTKLPLELNIFKTNHTLVVTCDELHHEWYQQHGIQALYLPKNQQHQVDLYSLLKLLGERNIASVLVEGGMTVQQNFFKENLINKIHVYLADVIIGTLETKQALQNMTTEFLGNNLHLTGYLNREHNHV